jgi:RHS repeat-associated protein
VDRHRKYDPFGDRRGTAAPTDIVFGYTGKYFDDVTGLQNNWNRWYDPKQGRFISQDPIGFAGGDENLYRYVGNSPTNATDPSGLQDPAIEKEKRRDELRRRMREEMEEKGVGESEIRLRLAVIESLMQSRITESGNTRDSFWKENKKGYYVPNGDAVDAIRYLTRNPYNQVMCNKYSSIILIQGYVRYFEEMKDREIGDRGLEGLRRGLNEKVIPEELPGEGNGIFFVELKGLIPHSSLLPGDQVWFQNPYNTGKFKTLGEEGSNIFYVGDGMVMQLYGNRSTFKIEDYPEQCMSDWRSISNRQKVDFSKIQIMGVRRPIAPPEDSEP